jgi:sugar phosphate isomerase/epimerase
MLGVNLSFCVKRWVTPRLWAPIVREELGLRDVQLSMDLVDPMWPDTVIARCAEDIRRETAAYDLHIHSAFTGLAHYAFNQLLHPDRDVRDYAEEWLMRAYRFAALAGISSVGGPHGAIASARNAEEREQIPEADYTDLVARLRRLAEAAAKEGLRELYIEPTPLRREWPWTIAQALRMMGDLEGTPVPWKFCLDWGHATFEPLYGARAGMEPWLQQLRSQIGIIHVQQTDFQYDRHWDFTEKGKVDAEQAAALHRGAGLEECPVFLEVFYPFERDDASVLNAMRRSIAILKPAFAREEHG